MARQNYSIIYIISGTTTAKAFHKNIIFKYYINIINILFLNININILFLNIILILVLNIILFFKCLSSNLLQAWINLWNSKCQILR